MHSRTITITVGITTTTTITIAMLWSLCGSWSPVQQSHGECE
jgi:hypothetical protein